MKFNNMAQFINATQPPILALETVFPEQARSVGRFAAAKMVFKAISNEQFIELYDLELRLRSVVYLTYAGQVGLVNPSWHGVCPTCVNDSLVVYPRQNAFKCHKCGSEGTIDDLLALKLMKGPGPGEPPAGASAR